MRSKIKWKFRFSLLRFHFKSLVKMYQTKGDIFLAYTDSKKDDMPNLVLVGGEEALIQSCAVLLYEGSKIVGKEYHDILKDLIDTAANVKRVIERKEKEE